MQHSTQHPRHGHFGPTGALVLALVGLTSAPATAAPLAAQRGTPKLRVAKACPTLFGAAATLARNARVRAARVDWIEEEDGVTVAHSHPRWEEPTPLEVHGVRLVGIQGRTALFDLDPVQAAALSCKPGKYRLGVDDSIGGRSRVIAVLRRGVLVEWGGVLRFITAPGRRSPRFVMGWRLPGEIALEPTPSAVGGRGYRRRVVRHRSLGSLLVGSTDQS